jgi:hypothetical protein
LLFDALQVLVTAGIYLDLVAHLDHVLGLADALIRVGELGDMDQAVLAGAVAAFLAADSVEVERLTKDGRRRFDARAAVVSMAAASDEACAILRMVVQHVTPAVRPDDVLSGLRAVSDLVTPVPPAALRLAQGPLTADGEVADPLAPDRQVGETR